MDAKVCYCDRRDAELVEAKWQRDELLSAAKRVVDMAVAYGGGAGGRGEALVHPAFYALMQAIANATKGDK